MAMNFNPSSETLIISPLAHRLQAFSRLDGWRVVVAGLVVLVGWMTENETLKWVVPGLVAVNPVTALVFVLAAGVGKHRRSRVRQSFFDSARRGADCDRWRCNRAALGFALSRGRVNGDRDDLAGALPRWSATGSVDFDGPAPFSSSRPGECE